MSAVSVPWRRPMSGRDPDEEHRASTPLELLFDLCFVVAVSAAAATLHHDLVEGHLGSGLAGYAMVFFAIWWAWVNYSWFASAYDSGDVVLRVTTFVIMTGVLVVAAGIPSAAGSRHDFRLLVVGYVIMRIALVPLWLRVAHEHPEGRPVALRYAGGITVVQVLWIARLWFDQGTVGGISFVVFALLELAIPWYAEHNGPRTPWHPRHIAERYELFTIIVLGEVLLATSQGISATLDAHEFTGQLLMLIVGGLLIVFGLWWLYFKRSMVDSLNEKTSFVFGYAHYLTFASIAAVGAALDVLVEVIQHEAHLEARTAVLVLTVAIAVYLLSLAAVHALGGRSASRLAPAAIVSAILLVVALLGLEPGLTVLLLGLVVAGAVVQHVSVTQPRRLTGE